MLKQVFFALVIASLVVLAAGIRPANEAQAIAPQPPGSLSPQMTDGTNLLVNGNFDQMAMYWRPTNHFVGNMWWEWWVDPNVPEFLNGGSEHHNACYPIPQPGRTCADDHNKSQGYIRWGAPYIAGVLQPVPVKACLYYRLQGYNRNDDTNYHSKIGIDPLGWQQPMGGERAPDNCPPDNASRCPDPSFDSASQIPSSIVWSPEFSQPGLTWGVQSVTAEAMSTTITVWTFSAPEKADSLSTYFDELSLVQVPSPSGKLIGDGTLPASDGFITNVTTETTSLRAVLSWRTSQPALTQVLYHYVGDATMASPPPQEDQVANYESSTSIDDNPAINHQARLPNLRPMSLYDYVILSRRLAGSSCQTSVFTGRLTTTDRLVPEGALPAPSNDIIGMTILPFEHSAYVIWQSAKPSYSQVLYHYSGPITPTIFPTQTQHVFLPVVSVGLVSDSTANYEFRTVPITTSSTLHIIQLTGLLSDSLYTAAAISAWTEGDQDMVAVSGRTGFRTQVTPTLQAAEPSLAQLTEQLLVCLAGGKQLEACAGELR